MNPVDSLKAVLCGPDGKCCSAGSQADRDTVDTALAAIQHYLDQHKAELPVLPEESIDSLWVHLNTWSESSIEACDEVAELCDNEIKTLLQAYGLKCAAHARKLALMDAIKQVTILYEKDDYPVLTDICNLIATAK